MTHLMKALILAFVAPVVWTTLLSAQANTENPEFTLAIHTDKAQVTKGADVEIAITITNISGDPFPYSFGYDGRMPNGYHFEIRDDQGNEVHRFGPRYKQMPDVSLFRLPDRPAGSSRQAAIAPGKSEEEQATISDEYPFRSPGPVFHQGLETGDDGLTGSAGFNESLFECHHRDSSTRGRRSAATLAFRGVHPVLVVPIGIAQNCGGSWSPTHAAKNKDAA